MFIKKACSEKRRRINAHKNPCLRRRNEKQMSLIAKITPSENHMDLIQELKHSITWVEVVLI